VNRIIGFLALISCGAFLSAHEAQADCSADKDFVELQMKAQLDKSFQIADFIDVLSERLATAESYCGYDHVAFRYLMKAAITELEARLQEQPVQAESPTAFAHMTMLAVVSKAYSEGRYGFQRDGRLTVCKGLFGKGIPPECRVLDRAEFTHLPKVFLPDGWQNSRILQAVE
jgi:hypothetical protein